MEIEENQTTTPFQLQFDKPLASQVKFAEWNPEKDLLAMVTEDSKILLHRFNWQRLWTISPGKCVTALCWRPDGKAIAVGLEDGTISLHDVENGKLMRSVVKSHSVAVVCLNWEEDGQLNMDDGGNISTYEDRTPRFFPPAPRVPRIPGVVSGDTGFMDDNEDSFRELSNSSHQCFNILCSGDKDGNICFSIFGIFHIGKINIHNFSIFTPHLGEQATCQLQNASIYKLALSRDLCHLIVLSIGDLVQDKKELKELQMSTHGLHCLLLNTCIFQRRKNELHQVALQASNIEDLIEVIRASLSVMCKQWSAAMHTFHEKFDPLSSLIVDHGLDSCPQEEFLSLLGGARTSPPVHQFLVNSLGEVGLKRVAKAIHNAGKELHLVVQEHLQPAAEIISFRIGELRGLSRWRARYQGVGLDENLIDNATEKAGMLVVQVERFMRVLATVLYQFQNFFTWLTKCVKLLMSELKLLMTEPSDQLPPFNSELVIIFLKFLYDQDPVRQLLEPSEVDHSIEIDLDTMQRLKELVQFGGFSDTKFLQRTLAKEFEQMEYSFKEAFEMPFTTISKKIHCEDLLPLCPLPSSPTSVSLNIPTSIAYYKDVLPEASTYAAYQQRFVDYMCFIIPEDSFLHMPNCLVITRGFMHGSSGTKKGDATLEAVLLHVPDGYHCVDVSLYKENQVILLLNETTAISENPENARMMMFQASDLSFVSVSGSSNANHWKLNELKECVKDLQMKDEKVRCIPHSVTAPLVVSASRGVACVFAARKRALVYILDEDEDDETSDVESLPFLGSATL